jgi:aconitate hydratase
MILHLLDMHQAIQTAGPFAITSDKDSNPIWVRHDLTERQAKILLAGGLLNATKASIES